MEEHPVQLCECRAEQPSPHSRKDLERSCFSTLLAIARLDVRLRDCVLQRLPLLKEVITGWRGHGTGRSYPLVDSYSRLLQVRRLTLFSHHCFVSHSADVTTTRDLTYIISTIHVCRDSVPQVSPISTGSGSKTSHAPTPLKPSQGAGSHGPKSAPPVRRVLVCKRMWVLRTRSIPWH